MQNPIAKIPLYLTFDDVLLLPQHSEFLPSAVSTKTQFTKNLTLNLPFISAAMDTVTESKMAIAMAKSGGIGVLHRSLSPETQADEVRKVKRASSIIIREPITVDLNIPLSNAKELMLKNKISGLPVIDKHNKLVGILTSRDIKSATTKTSTIQEVTTTSLITAQEPVNVSAAQRLIVKADLVENDLSKVSEPTQLIDKKTGKLPTNIQVNSDEDSAIYSSIYVASISIITTTVLVVWAHVCSWNVMVGGLC